MDPEALGWTVWAYGRLGVRHDALLERLARHALTADGFLGRCLPRHLVHIAWAFAALGSRGARREAPPPRPSPLAFPPLIRRTAPSGPAPSPGKPSIRTPVLSTTQPWGANT